MRNLTVRAQFDTQVWPSQICYFDLGAEYVGWRWPEQGAPEWLQVAPNGYLEHRFDVCRRATDTALSGSGHLQDNVCFCYNLIGRELRFMGHDD